MTRAGFRLQTEICGTFLDMRTDEAEAIASACNTAAALRIDQLMRGSQRPPSSSETTDLMVEQCLEVGCVALGAEQLWARLEQLLEGASGTALLQVAEQLGVDGLDGSAEMAEDARPMILEAIVVHLTESRGERVGERQSQWMGAAEALPPANAAASAVADANHKALARFPSASSPSGGGGGWDPFPSSPAGSGKGSPARPAGTRRSVQSNAQSTAKGEQSSIDRARQLELRVQELEASKSEHEALRKSLQREHARSEENLALAYGETMKDLVAQLHAAEQGAAVGTRDVTRQASSSDSGGSLRVQAAFESVVRLNLSKDELRAVSRMLAAAAEDPAGAGGAVLEMD